MYPKVVVTITNVQLDICDTVNTISLIGPCLVQCFKLFVINSQCVLTASEILSKYYMYFHH